MTDHTDTFSGLLDSLNEEQQGEEADERAFAAHLFGKRSGVETDEQPTTDPQLARSLFNN